MVNLAKRETAVRWMLSGMSIAMLARGVDRISEGHPVSGWLMAVSGVGMLASAVGLWLRRRRY
jgi:hypothetical protein